MYCKCTVRILRVCIDTALASCKTKHMRLAAESHCVAVPVWMAPFLICYKAAKWLKRKGML
jgi:hypothetical protein